MDTIVIPNDDRHDALVAFVGRSALAGCTTVAHTVTSTGSGAVMVTRNWPHLSSGEETLWRLLDSLVDGDLADALARLDDRNLAAVVDVVTAVATPIIDRAAEARAHLVAMSL